MQILKQVVQMLLNLLNFLKRMGGLEDFEITLLRGAFG